MSQWFLSYSLYCCCFISAYSFHNYLSLYGSWQKKQAFNQHQSASHLLVLWPTAIKVKNPYFAQIESQREQYIIDL